MRDKAERIGGEGSECADCDKRGACPWRRVRRGVVNGDLGGSEKAETRAGPCRFASLCNAAKRVLARQLADWRRRQLRD